MDWFRISTARRRPPKDSIPVGDQQRCAAGPGLAAAIREAQAARAAGQIDRPAARENESAQLFNSVADLQRVRQAAGAGIANLRYGTQIFLSTSPPWFD